MRNALIPLTICFIALSGASPVLSSGAAADGESILVGAGLEKGDRLCLTELADTIDGVTKVKPQLAASDDPILPEQPGLEPLKP